MSEIQEAIDQWRACANNHVMYPEKAMRDICERTAVALEIERDTGIAVCSCCHKETCDKVSRESQWWKQPRSAPARPVPPLKSATQEIAEEREKQHTTGAAQNVAQLTLEL